MSELRWDPKSSQEQGMAYEVFRQHLAADYDAFTPEGVQLRAFNEAEGVIVFRKVPRRSALDRLLDEDK